MSKGEQQTRGGFIPVGDLALDLPDVQVPARRQARHFTTLDQVTQLVRDADPELGFMARLLAAAHQPQKQARVQARQRSVHALHGGRRRQQTTLRHPAASAPGVGVHRSGTDAITRAHPRRFALGVHAEGGHLQHQRRQAHQTSESDAAAVWVYGLAALRGCARGSHAERADCPSHGVLVERAPAG